MLKWTGGNQMIESSETPGSGNNEGMANRRSVHIFDETPVHMPTSLLHRSPPTNDGMYRCRSDSNILASCQKPSTANHWKKKLAKAEALSHKQQKRMSKTCSIVSGSMISSDSKRWNVFRSIPRDQDVFTARWTELASQALKVFMYLLLHLTVLTSGVMSKMLMLLFVANLRSDIPFTPCKNYGRAMGVIPQDPEILPKEIVTWYYWALYGAICFPELLVFIRSVRFCFFKFVPNPSMLLLLFVFITETMHSVGVCFLIFLILPNMDSLRAVLLLCGVTTVPLFLKVCHEISSCSRNCLAAFLEFGVLLLHSTGLLLWPILDTNLKHRFLIPFALMLISTGWWENYAEGSTSKFACMAFLGKLKELLQKSRYKVYAYISVWKCLLILFVMIMAAGVDHQLIVLFDFSNPFLHYNSSAILTRIDKNFYASQMVNSAVLLIASGFVCYETAKFVCKVKMDRFSYAIPMASIIPLTLIMLVSFCERKAKQPCYMSNLLTDKIFWNCEYGSFLDDFLIKQASWIGIFWFAAYLWATVHIFIQKPGRLSRTDTLFVLPMYSGLLVDQSLMLNRRRQPPTNRIRTTALDDTMANDDSIATEGTEMSLANSMTSLSLTNSNADTITKIYICATMWHETATEMTQMLKSIMRMDEDQCARKNAQRYLKVIDCDYCRNSKFKHRR